VTIKCLPFSYRASALLPDGTVQSQDVMVSIETARTWATRLEQCVSPEFPRDVNVTLHLVAEFLLHLEDANGSPRIEV